MGPTKNWLMTHRWVPTHNLENTALTDIHYMTHRWVLTHNLENTTLTDIKSPAIWQWYIIIIGSMFCS